MRKKKKKNHPLADYLVLIFLAIIALTTILSIGDNKFLIRTITIVFSASYLSWGIWHHRREKTLHLEIVIEYFLISLLGTAIVLGII